tara:strand:+ start:3070 stop:3834 length:765 start_codon:yes stop_codon:yes gene_type:complete
MIKKNISKIILDSYLTHKLDVNRFQDYCPNGLQVEGNENISFIASGVTASMDFLKEANLIKADALLVHHGYFWKGDDQRITGTRKKRIKYLLENNINLFAYHLPLDVHSEFGNNVQFAKRLGIEIIDKFGKYDLICLGKLESKFKKVSDLVNLVENKLQRSPTLIGDTQMPLGKVAWCTGAAQNSFEEAIIKGASVFISGEISEQTVHLARESSVAYLSCGHHATERYGVQALGEHIADNFGIKHKFIDIHNPI